MPDGSTGSWTRAAYGGSDCPEGAALVPGDSIIWHSSGNVQGSTNVNGGNRIYPDTNGCTAKGLCGLPYSPAPYTGLGGGWQVCFV